MTREAMEFYKVLLKKKEDYGMFVPFTFSDNLATKILQIKCMKELINEGLVDEIDVSPNGGQYFVK